MSAGRTMFDSGKTPMPSRSASHGLIGIVSSFVSSGDLGPSFQYPMTPTPPQNTWVQLSVHGTTLAPVRCSHSGLNPPQPLIVPQPRP